MSFYLVRSVRERVIQNRLKRTFKGYRALIQIQIQIQRFLCFDKEALNSCLLFIRSIKYLNKINDYLDILLSLLSLRLHPKFTKPDTRKHCIHISTGLFPASWKLQILCKSQILPCTDLEKLFCSFFFFLSKIVI